MLRWLIFLILVIAWTVGLELPVPDPGHLPGGAFIVTNKVIFAKGMHVLVYALLTVMAVWVPLPVPYRWLMMFFLMGHAWGSEMLQEVLEEYCHRGGKLSDVGFDVMGIVLGALVSWKWWTRIDTETKKDGDSNPNEMGIKAGKPPDTNIMDKG